MNKDKYVFAQLVGFLDNFKFLRIVKKYEGDKYIKSYTCWNQLLNEQRNYRIFEEFATDSSDAKEQKNNITFTERFRDLP